MGMPMTSLLWAHAEFLSRPQIRHPFQCGPNHFAVVNSRCFPHTDLSLAILRFMHPIHIEMVILATTTSVQLIHWHDSPPPEQTASPLCLFQRDAANGRGLPVCEFQTGH